MKFLVDIGNVLLTFDFESSLRKLIPAGVTDEALRLRRLLQRKDELESGRIAVAEYIVEASQHLGFTGPEEDFRTAWCEIFEINRPMWDLVERLASDGHELILFSNINGIHAPYLLETYSIFEKFHGAVFSHEVGEIKPHEPIYRAAIERHDLVPEETVYIDDLEANVATGKRLGFQAFQYDHRRHDELLEWLEPRLAKASA